MTWYAVSSSRLFVAHFASRDYTATVNIVAYPLNAFTKMQITHRGEIPYSVALQAAGTTVEIKRREIKRTPPKELRGNSSVKDIFSNQPILYSDDQEPFLMFVAALNDAVYVRAT